MPDAIVVYDLGKRFRRYHADRPKRLKEVFVRGLHRFKPVDYFWALRSVNFEVPAGRTVGIVGHNGSGKSTLLNLIGDVLQPDEGRVEVRGRMSALLSLGAGFHSDLTGRENVFVNGIISGLTRQEVKQQFDSIVDFAELEEFIDSPIRTFSTGMRMRLGFAIAIHMEPEILLIDEVLAVGDAAFRQKCIDRINQFKKEGRTILIVSHTSDQIQKLCDEVIWLQHGQVVERGDPEETLLRYLADMNKHAEARPGISAGQSDLQSVNKAQDQINRNHPHRSKLKLVTVRLLDQNAESVFEINNGDSLNVEIEYLVSEPVKNPIFRVAIIRKDNILCYATTTAAAGLSISTVIGPGKISLQLDRLDLNKGQYYVDVGIHEHNWSYAYDYHWRLYPLSVRSHMNGRGVLQLPHDWVLNGQSVADADDSGPRSRPIECAKVAMFHIGRSGSTVLTNLLNQHPGIFWDAEIYERHFQDLEKQGQVVKPGELVVDPIKLLRQRINQSDQELYGFETKFYHLRLTDIKLSDFVAQLQGLGFNQFIILERKNYLRKIVSSLIAKQKSRYHQPAGQEAVLTQIRLEVAQVQIDRDSRPLMAYLNDFQERFRRLDKLLTGANVLRLTYEDDILADPLVGCRRLYDFLGLEHYEPTIEHGRTNPFKLDEIIINFNEVEWALRGTPFEWMLYE
jgi:lipopolysaccharide transport system ATP-binding protein